MSEVIEQLGSWQRRTSSPPIPDAIGIVGEVLGHGRDYVEHIDLDEAAGVCRVEWSWSVRCCEQSETYDIPISVLTAEDVRTAARIWRLEESRAEYRGKLASYEHSAKFAQEKISEIDAELLTLRATPNNATRGMGE